MMTTSRYAGLAGASVFVTGGGSGIGESIVEHFCAQGAQVAFVDMADAPSQALVARLSGTGAPPPLFIHCDLRDIEALQAAVAQAAAAHGPVTRLVNNAGNDDRHGFDTVTVAYWDDRMATNLRHQFFAAQAVHPMMKQAGGGSIVNFGSISWMVGEGGYPAYTTAKAAIGGLTKTLARDLGRDHIRVNTVVPGWVMTRRQIELWLDETGEREIAQRQCLPDKLMPHDLAKMVLFLASDDSQMCTGQNFIVDGGWV